MDTEDKTKRPNSYWEIQYVSIHKWPDCQSVD